MRSADFKRKGFGRLRRICPPPRRRAGTLAGREAFLPKARFPETGVFRKCTCGIFLAWVPPSRLVGRHLARMGTAPLARTVVVKRKILGGGGCLSFFLQEKTVVKSDRICYTAMEYWLQLSGVEASGFPALALAEWYKAPVSRREARVWRRRTVSLFTAFILGIIQGVSEFLPISSSGHQD